MRLTPFFPLVLLVVSLSQTPILADRLELSPADLRWVASYLKKTRLDAAYNKSPQKERLEQARKLAAPTT
ncbi:hypothetical protein EON83_27420 [bacterium]|nr:MAG: hypothetical protein EON83_27420 [bacterium]